MRVALFTDTFPPEVNGVANTVAQTARSLAARGHEVCICTVSGNSADELRDLLGVSYEIFTIPSIRISIYLGVHATIPIGWSISKMRTFRPDVIHAHTPFSVGWEGVRAARKLRVPLVGTHHTFFNHYLEHIYLNFSWAERLSWKITTGYYNRCDMVISPTRALEDEMKLHGLKKRGLVVPNPIDTKTFSSPSSDARLRAKKIFGVTGPTLLYMGRVSYEKSINQVIRAFAEVQKSIAGAHLLIVGDGPEREKLQHLVVSLQLESKVTFTGFLFGEKLVEAMHACDVFVTASKSENMPLAVLEAMGCGLPVIAPQSLGLSEMVENGGNGFLLPPDKPEEIAKKALELFADTAMQRKYSDRSRMLALGYSEDAVMERLERVYREVIK